jgi:hypothetical protein
MMIKITGPSSYEISADGLVVVNRVFAPPPSEEPEGMVWNGVMHRFITEAEDEEIRTHGKMGDTESRFVRRDARANRQANKYCHASEFDIAKEFKLADEDLQTFKERHRIIELRCSDVDGVFVPSLSRFPFEGRYIEVRLGKQKGRVGERLQSLTESLRDIVKHEVEITSRPPVSKFGGLCFGLNMGVHVEQRE